MPPALVIASGTSAGKEFWIQDDVVRIGGGPQCEVQVAVPGLAPHAATVEFIDGRFLVYNRSDHSVHLDGHPVDSRAGVRWNEGQVLQLGGDVGLRLRVDGDPKPARRPTPRPTIPDDPGPADDRAADVAAPRPRNGSQRSRSWLRLAVIGGCAAAIAVLLMSEPSDGGGGGASHPDPAGIRRAFAAAVAAPAGAVGVQWEEVRVTLQDARISELRGDRRRTRALYARVRDRLAPRGDKGRFASPAEQAAWDFALSRLD